MVRFSSTAGNNWFRQFPSIPAYFFFGLDSGCDSKILIYTLLKKTNQHIPYIPPGTCESMIFSSFSRGKPFRGCGKVGQGFGPMGCFLVPEKWQVSPGCKLGLFVSEDFAEIWSRRFLLLNFGFNGWGGSVFPEFVYIKDNFCYSKNLGGSWETTISMASIFLKQKQVPFPSMHADRAWDGGMYGSISVFGDRGNEEICLLSGDGQREGSDHSVALMVASWYFC